MLSCRPKFFNMAIVLWSSFVLDLLQVVHQLDDVYTSTFDKPTTILGLAEQPFWRMPLSQHELVDCRAIETFHRSDFYLWDFGSSNAFRSFCCMQEFGDGFDGAIFTTLIEIVAEIAIVSFHTLPVGFPLPTISKNSLFTLFCPWISDHGVSFIISVFWPQILNS